MLFIYLNRPAVKAVPVKRKEFLLITYDYYRIFYYVALYHSFTKAAEILGNNQPNITRCMNNLESELDCKLFVRSNRGVKLTPEEERLLSHVTVAHEQLQYGEEELRRDRSLESGHITIGASETALHMLLLDRLERFHEEYPNVRLKISNYSTPQAIVALENGRIDFAIVSTPANIKKPLRKIPLHSFREILIGGAKYRHLSQKASSLAELSDYPFISLGKDTSTRELYIQYFLNHDLTFRPDMEAATADQILPMIIHNLGIGFYPEELAREVIARGDAFPVKLEEPAPGRELCLLLDDRHTQSIAVQKILKEFLQK